MRSESNSGVTAVSTPVSPTLLLKQTSPPEPEPLCQEILLSAPGTPRRLMPGGDTMPGPSLRLRLAVPPFASCICSKTAAGWSTQSVDVHTSCSQAEWFPCRVQFGVSRFSHLNYHKWKRRRRGGGKDWGQGETPSLLHLIPAALSILQSVPPLLSLTSSAANLKFTAVRPGCITADRSSSRVPSLPTQPSV